MKVDFKQEFIERVMESQGIVHKICSIYCDDKEQRKDLFQEILIQLWKSYSSFRGEAKFSSWMYQVALNVAIQHLRKSKKRPDKVKLSQELHQLTEPATNNDSLEEKTELLYYAIRQLNDVEKAIIMLHLEEKSNQEIAQITGISQNYVRVKMNRIKSALKKTLKPQPNGV